ncbi:carboxymuconolactone decarboxylase family protein [Sporomusa aerivorans]|uniref:carboxymuconolactone decarboxylase family protein n=1 Tax=Sporomusa aerivorans TaxID=204936 RepID=UPI00352AB794
MNRKITTILLGVFITVFSLTTISEAKSINDQGLDARQQGIVTIAAFTARGDLPKLKTALNEGLDAGLTVNEIKEVLVQMYAYCGFPRSLNGITTFMSVMEERKAKGIQDEMGKEASPLPTNKSRIELGTEVQTGLIGAPARGQFSHSPPPLMSF